MDYHKRNSVVLEKKSNVAFKIFRAAGVVAWEKPVAAAAEFAATLDRDQLINISHSSDNGNGTVIVWYHKELL